MKALIPLLLLLPGCTSLSTQLPDVSVAAIAAEQSFQEKQIFAEMARHQIRLDQISSKILSANADICEKSGLGIGAITHNLKSYSKKLRPAAKREIGAAEKPRILFVRAGSPADNAGLKPGDSLVDAQGKVASIPSKSFSTALKNNTPLTQISGDKQTPISFQAEPECAYPVRLKMSPAINAYANGKSLIVTAGMMEFAKSDDELALIIGHELAHNELGHIRKIITNYALSLGATRYTRSFESEADYAGLYYAARAGFDLEDIEDIWRRLAKLSARPIARAKTHPTYPDRYVRLAAARDEIRSKQRMGIALVPNRTGDKN